MDNRREASVVQSCGQVLVANEIDCWGVWSLVAY
jgi:hypothetical protein